MENVSLKNRHIETKNNFSGKSRDYLLFKLIKNSILNHYSDISEIIELFINDCKDDEYISYIQDLINTTSTIKDNEDILIKLDLKQISWEEIFNNYKGKYIYIDFWASWCAPCINLMQKSHEYEQLFKDKVVFLYMSIDDNSKSWIKASNVQSLDYNKSFLISKKSKFVGKYKIKSIPRYMLIDKNGTVINDNTFRSDDKDFVKKMNNVILKY